MRKASAASRRAVKAVPAYKNAALSSARRVKDLLSRMTLEEKAAQMICVCQKKAQMLVDDNGKFDREKAKRSFLGRSGLGQVGRPNDAGGGRSARDMAELTNSIQRFFLKESRLGIPVFFHEECLHGLWARDVTSFPQPIALASTFSPELVESLYAMAALETRSRGAHQALTPVIDVARDPRWGRCEETYGEDPYLVACMGTAAVRGFQGDSRFRDKTHVIATLKHFAAHGQPESGINCGPANVSMRSLRETFLYPFKRAVQAGRAISVMASYNEIDGVPSHANKWLLDGVLRKEWGFKGFVVSDYDAIWELNYRPSTHGHFIAKDKMEACALAVNAGVNIEFPDPDCYLHIVKLVHKGAIKISQINKLIAPMLFWKFEMGLFDDPYVDPAEAERIAGCESHRELALRAAKESITLLKNEDNLAPLDIAKIGTIAVIGPNADRTLLGGYSGVPKQEITVLEGIKERVRDRIKVVHAEGCKITVGGSWLEDKVVASDPQEDRRAVEHAVQVARDADAIVLVLGGNEQTSREAWGVQHLGDRPTLELVGRQEALVKAILALGKPVIVFLFNGRPLSINYLSLNVPVIYECWYLGQEAGRAIAAVLFGDCNPSGKLPITIPRSAGHLPAFYNHKPSARRGYLFDDVSPLYPFGFGLSYTSFRIKNPRLKRNRISASGSTSVLVEVANTGRREGAEVVQLYIRDLVSSVTRPIKELKGFSKVYLKPGEATTVELKITPDLLGFYDRNMKWVVEPGEFEVMVGSSSQDCDLVKVLLTVTK